MGNTVATGSFRVIVHANARLADFGRTVVSLVL